MIQVSFIEWNKKKIIQVLEQIGVDCSSSGAADDPKMTKSGGHQIQSNLEKNHNWNMELMRNCEVLGLECGDGDKSR